MWFKGFIRSIKENSLGKKVKRKKKKKKSYQEERATAAKALKKSLGMAKNIQHGLRAEMRTGTHLSQHV